MLSPLCIAITIYVLVLLLSTTTDALQLYQQQQHQPFLHQQQHQKYYHRDQYSSTTVMSAAAAAVPGGGDYDRSTVHADAYLLPKLQQAFGPNLKKYEILETIVQPNAVGFKLKLFPPPSLEPENDEDSNNTDTDATKTESAASSSSWPDEVFFKQVLATDYQSNRKDWSDLRRTLLYARTELRFYRDVLPIMKDRGFYSAPKVYYVDYNFEGWIAESEPATTPADATLQLEDLIQNEEESSTTTPKGGWLILQCVSTDTYYQNSPLPIPQVQHCLRAAADLHASAWEDHALLTKAEQELSRAAFHLQMRNPKELAGIEQAWDHFLEHFQSDLERNWLWTDTKIHKLGQRLKAVAEYVSTEISPALSSGGGAGINMPANTNTTYATMIHGDYKAMNVMLGKDPKTTPTIMIDFATASVGYGMSDVAMHIHHACLPSDLDNGGEEMLVEYYIQTLRDNLRRRRRRSGVSKSSDDNIIADGDRDDDDEDDESHYPHDIALRHYKFAVVDYARFFIGRMWKTATPATMHSKKNNTNIANINRDIPSAMRFIRIVDQYLTEIENEIASASSPLLSPS